MQSEKSDDSAGPPALEELSLSSTKVPYNVRIITSVIEALGRNHTLQVLDITGNIGGDAVAESLSQALRTNTSLRALFWYGLVWCCVGKTL